MTKLVDLTVTQFMETLGSDAPAPGGGSASALSGSMGISLVKMVTELTIGKKKYAEFEEEMLTIRDQASTLQTALLTSIDKDTEAFNGVSAVFAMPKDTDEQKAERSAALQEALKRATLVPYEVMELLVKALCVTKGAVGKSNTNAASDLGVGAVNLKSALQGAWLNVLINLSGIKDEQFVQEYKNKGKELLEEGSALADHIYQIIEESV
ncbi:MULTISPECIES: cyclodeaminase/cyclohydrolase family protein [unclassified Granulicatella]|uniref:cyclodeaminase/cyclohydrolase family protein n=1 Tax=unclassified Granulicatella TaxID=2630493 RepID=UPI00107350B7|nr:MULTISPECIES: cyclodeaminase/cyclohydrolase family protein [unclassified Granulicatella]MBF0780098.1 cyclodeaminase/cyclohydrolase family protein [Granulicatella sp. 19428wC4_WM01]TFU95824.1 sugar ABC transporter substrate-binding protein [Granulicatella sp. WM01]